MRTFTRCARPTPAPRGMAGTIGMGVPSRCQNCDKKVRFQKNGVNNFLLVGHPWGINDGAWWCEGCLHSAGYETESGCTHGVVGA